MPTQTHLDLVTLDRARVLRAADEYLSQEPVTITAFPAPAARTAGGQHDFFSEGDYWWPNPDDPYIQRDGRTHLDNFVAHRPPDVMFWEFWPVRSPALLFAGLAYGERKYLDLWTTLDADPTNEEVIRNLPLRQPLLWVDVPPATPS